MIGQEKRNDRDGDNVYEAQFSQADKCSPGKQKQVRGYRQTGLPAKHRHEQ
jgi:hypothetical protein